MEEKCPWVNSVAAEIDLDSGVRLEIAGISSIHKGKLAPQVKDLKMFMPNVIEKKNDYLKVSKLTIPDERSPLALRRVLASVISVALPGVDRKKLLEEVNHAEQKLLDINENYWNDLSDMLDSVQNSGIKTELKKLTNKSIEHIMSYRKRLLRRKHDG